MDMGISQHAYTVAGWSTPKSFTFMCTPHTVLAVEGTDAEGGCSGGGFAMKCTSSNSESPWNNLEASSAWKSWGGPRTADNYGVASPPSGWYQPNFDDSGWDQASTGSQSGSYVGSSGSICNSQGPGWLFRSPRF